MLVIISPSKTMTMSDASEQHTTLPDFNKEYRQLLGILQKKSKPALQTLMKISDKIAREVWENLQSFPEALTNENASPAALSYRGDVYLGLQANLFTADDWSFAGRHLRILSGLYGVLRPSDLVRPYRLEMGLSMKIGKSENLYKYWGKKIALKLKTEIEKQEINVLLNLASGEYMKSVNLKALGHPVVDVDFREEKNGKLTSNSFTNKRMRGVMARYIIQHRVNHPEVLKSFSEEGFRYREEWSSPGHFVFVR